MYDVEMPDAGQLRDFRKNSEAQPPFARHNTYIPYGRMRKEFQSGQEGEIYIEKSGNIEHLKSAIAEILKRFYPERSTNA